MRHHNRARLIDITDMDLDPTVEHVAGPDGRLGSSSNKPEKDKQGHDKNKADDEVIINSEETSQAADTLAEDTSKKVVKTSKKAVAKV